MISSLMKAHLNILSVALKIRKGRKIYFAKAVSKVSHVESSDAFTGQTFRPFAIKL